MGVVGVVDVLYSGKERSHKRPAEDMGLRERVGLCKFWLYAIDHLKIRNTG